MFKIFVTVDEHQSFKSLTVERHLSGLNIRPATLKIRLLIISKLLIISSNFRLQASILLWLKLTPTYLYEKDNDVWQKKYSSVTS